MWDLSLKSRRTDTYHPPGDSLPCKGAGFTGQCHVIRQMTVWGLRYASDTQVTVTQTPQFSLLGSGAEEGAQTAWHARLSSCRHSVVTQGLCTPSFELSLLTPPAQASHSSGHWLPGVSMNDTKACHWGFPCHSGLIRRCLGSQNSWGACPSLRAQACSALLAAGHLPFSWVPGTWGRAVWEVTLLSEAGEGFAFHTQTLA